MEDGLTEIVADLLAKDGQLLGIERLDVAGTIHLFQQVVFPHGFPFLRLLIPIIALIREQVMKGRHFTAISHKKTRSPMERSGIVF